MMASPVVAALLAAGAAIGHGIWDVVHLVRDKVVARTLAEACLVLDLGLGIVLLVATLPVIVNKQSKVVNHAASSVLDQPHPGWVL